MAATEQEIARMLLLEAQRGRLAQCVLQHIREGGVDASSVVATLLASLMQRGMLSAIEIARVVVRAPQEEQPKVAAGVPAEATLRVTQHAPPAEVPPSTATPAQLTPEPVTRTIGA